MVWGWVPQTLTADTRPCPPPLHGRTTPGQSPTKQARLGEVLHIFRRVHALGRFA